MKMLATVLLVPLLVTQSHKGPESSCAQLLSGRVTAATNQPKEPQKYRLRTEYTMLGPQGAPSGTHFVTGDFTASQDDVRWTTVTVGPSSGHGQPETSVEHQAYMEGFHYSRSDSQKMMTESFFHDFPANAHDEKNLVWDELMFDSFVRQSVDKMRLNEPVLAKSGAVALAGAGTFTNRRIELTWRGVGQWHGEECLLIHYEALLNQFTTNAGPMVITSRSDYMGDIWVSARTHRTEYGTLLEEVAGTIANLPGTNAPQPLHVLRIATLEHLQ